MTIPVPILAAIAAAGTAISAVGAIQQGRAAAAAARFNAQQSEIEARQVREAAAFDERRHRERVARLQGSARAAALASGITLEGSPTEILNTNAEQGELDALSIRFGGASRSRALESEAMLSRFQDAQARRSGLIGAGATVLTGASQVGRILNEA